ncbi:glycoside hydrolase, partial [Rhyzopertha dominica]
MKTLILMVLVGGVIENVKCESLNTNKFPDGFIFGTATSAYQIEGAWNTSGKSASIWDTLTHNNPEYVSDGSNGDIACDSYAHAIDDIELIKDLGLDFYRFSLSWTRILPTGFIHDINADGIRYYNEVLDELEAQNISAMVTLYHWDLPQTLQEMGGWINEAMVQFFEDYARVAFENFGDRVKYWTTFNEPMQHEARLSVSLHPAPEMDRPLKKLTTRASETLASNSNRRRRRPLDPNQDNSSSLGSESLKRGVYLERIGSVIRYSAGTEAVLPLYQLRKNPIIKYDKPYFTGNISITIHHPWFEADSDSEEDAEAAERMMQFYVGWFSHPIFGSGGYPEVMKRLVANRSALEGFPESRLPEFTQEEIEYIKGTSDYLGLNHYTTWTAKYNEGPIGSPLTQYDSNVVIKYYTDQWPSSPTAIWLQVFPFGFRKLLKWIQDEYNVTIYITENGFADDGTITDVDRITYHQLYLSQLLDAIYEDGIDIRAYTIWSLLDNFEWLSGYG